MPKEKQSKSKYHRPKTVLLNVNVPSDIKRKVKAALALQGKTITSVVIEALQREIAKANKQ